MTWADYHNSDEDSGEIEIEYDGQQHEGDADSNRWWEGIQYIVAHPLENLSASENGIRNYSQPRR